MDDRDHTEEAIGHGQRGYASIVVYTSKDEDQDHYTIAENLVSIGQGRETGWTSACQSWPLASPLTS